MTVKRIAILLMIMVLPAGLLLFLLATACLAKVNNPQPEMLPAEPVEGLQATSLAPLQPDSARIQLVKTVGLDPILTQPDCPDTEFVYAPAGSRVYYCYRIVNTGSVTLTRHNLVDNLLGTILNDFPFTLPVGHSALLTQTDVISSTSVNIAAWTATDDSGSSSSGYSDRAGVFVAGPQTLACGEPSIDFNQGLPSNWQVASQPDTSPVYWTNVALAWEDANYTGGGGDAASVSSQRQNGGSGIYDTELRSPPFSLFGAGTVSIRYQANYQHLDNDALDLDISTNGGLSWATLLRWDDTSHGEIHGGVGEPVEVDLSPYTGRQNLILRWRYYNLVGPVNTRDLYAQIDNFSLQCEREAALELITSAQPDPSCNSVEINVVAPGTSLTYCYKISNIGPSLLSQHDLVDSQQGGLLSGFSFDLRPGASAILPQPVTILSDTKSMATWTASNPALGVSASASDILTIVVGNPIYLPFAPFQFAP
jgi:hypothetical protein